MRFLLIIFDLMFVNRLLADSLLEQTVICIIAHKRAVRSLDRAELNGSNCTLVTDCSQSVKLGVNRNDLGQQSVCQRSKSRTYSAGVGLVSQHYRFL